MLNITLEDSAHRAATDLLGAQVDSKKFLRVYIAGKHCDGFEYGVCLDDKNEDDLCTVQGQISIVCDRASLDFIDGSSLAWVDDERGRGFIVFNPNHKKFRGKFFKRENWKNKLTQST